MGGGSTFPGIDSGRMLHVRDDCRFFSFILIFYSPYDYQSLFNFK